MKKIIGIIILTFFLISSKSNAKTTICEITFYTDNIKYDCLMVLHDTNRYGNNYMRVGYTSNGNYVVINQLLSIEKQLLPDGNTYLTATGYGVRFITNSYGATYNPDKFSVLINASGVIDQPKMGDSNNAMMPVFSFRDVSNENLDYNYLKKFFLDGESELYTLSVSTFGNQLSASTPANYSMASFLNPMKNLSLAFTSASNQHTYASSSSNASLIARGFATPVRGHPLSVPEGSFSVEFIVGVPNSVLFSALGPSRDLAQVEVAEVRQDGGGCEINIIAKNTLDTNFILRKYKVGENGENQKRINKWFMFSVPFVFSTPYQIALKLKWPDQETLNLAFIRLRKIKKEK